MGKGWSLARSWRIILRFWRAFWTINLLSQSVVFLRPPWLGLIMGCACGTKVCKDFLCCAIREALTEGHINDLFVCQNTPNKAVFFGSIMLNACLSYMSYLRAIDSIDVVQYQDKCRSVLDCAAECLCKNHHFWYPTVYILLNLFTDRLYMFAKQHSSEYLSLLECSRLMWSQNDLIKVEP